MATLITSSFILSEDSSWLFLSFHVLYAYYLIFFWRPWLFPLWKWTIIAALLLTKSVEQKNKRVVFSMVNQQRSTLIIILHYSFLFCAWNMAHGKIKMSFTLPIMHEICMVTLKHNMNNKHKIEFTKRRMLWSHTVCLEESCLRVFDVNQCMKDRSNWPGVTLKFALFNHVFHVRCKKWSLVVYNFSFYHYCMRNISLQKSVKQFAAPKYGFSYHTQQSCLLWKTL